MSGLAAVFNRDGRPVDSDAVPAMLRAIPYRGPDGARVETFSSCTMGHARLIVSAEDELDRQPLVSRRTGCAIVADARLDNRDELMKRLPFAVPRSASDAELILCACDAWDTGAVQHLLGDFAFVVWDPRHRRVICARDTSGQRPLFYRLDARTFAAASEIHQLLQDPAVEVAPNERRIRDYLVELQLGRNEKDTAATFYAGILSVPAGHVLEVEPGSSRLTKYWELTVGREIRYRHDSDYEAHFRALLRRAIQDRLRGVGPAGMLLSGGLDSSSIACLAQDILTRGDVATRSLTGFTAVYDGLDCNERAFVEDIRSQTGMPVVYVRPGPSVRTRLQLEPAGFMEAPSMWNTAERDGLLDAATRAGVRLLLTGEVADNCIGGTQVVFDSLLRHGAWVRLFHDVRALRRVSGEPLRSIVLLYCLLPLLPASVQGELAVWRLRRTFARVRERVLPAWLADGLRDQLLDDVLARRIGDIRDRRFTSPAREGEYRLLYPPEVARSFGRWPIEFRRPFADRRLHEFLLAIPPEQKFHPHPLTDEFYAGSKWLLRRAMRGVLPESIRTRTSKTTFDAAFQRELADSWPTYEAAFGPTARSRIAARGYVDAARFWDRLQALRAGTAGSDFVYLLRLVELETWLRTLERRPVVERTDMAVAGGQIVRQKEGDQDKASIYTAHTHRVRSHHRPYERLGRE